MSGRANSCPVLFESSSMNLMLPLVSLAGGIGGCGARTSTSPCGERTHNGAWLAVQLIHCLDKLGLAQKMMLSALAWLACSGLSLICIPTPAAPAVEAVHSLCQQLVCA